MTTRWRIEPDSAIAIPEQSHILRYN